MTHHQFQIAIARTKVELKSAVSESNANYECDVVDETQYNLSKLHLEQCEFQFKPNNAK